MNHLFQPKQMAIVIRKKCLVYVFWQPNKSNEFLKLGMQKLGRPNDPTLTAVTHPQFA